MIVRNPYERLISEFYCKWGGIGNLNDKNIDEIWFNSYIKNCILDRDKKNHPRNKQNGHHHTEQYKYIVPNVSIHIIHIENLKYEFNELMKKYKLNILLDDEIFNKSRRKKI